jgi:phosphoribosylaminoimidazolecarboxamide formyltransferase / IMP cyclohydrolase
VTQQKIKRALLSVSDKSHLRPLAMALHEGGVEIISTGGTAKFIEDLNIPVTSVESLTSFAEAFGGRMKTISFQILSSILFRRNNDSDIEEAKNLSIEPIDLVVCNLYPFEEVAKENFSLEKLIENIDIGGPNMIRAAAKNYDFVTVLTNTGQYEDFIKEFTESSGGTSLEFRKEASLNAFQRTSDYDSFIAFEFEERQRRSQKEDFSQHTLHYSLKNAVELRYGENSHQKAYFYSNNSPMASYLKSTHGKELSYNNYLDIDSAYRVVRELHDRSFNKNYSIVSIIKHNNPCGLSMQTSNLKAITSAWAGDPMSSFGSIVCFSTAVDLESANFLSERFVEAVIAPSFTKEAKEILIKKKNLRLLEIPMDAPMPSDNLKTIIGGALYQQEDSELDLEFETVTSSSFLEDSTELVQFGTTACKFLKSNAIALVKKDGEGVSLVGAGMGNPNRFVSLTQAVEKAKENDINDFSEVVLISDAFFPFPDSVEKANEFHIKYIVQPGGSIKDSEVIKACEKAGQSMIFTRKRHFRH